MRYLPAPKLFGSVVRTAVLFVIATLGEVYSEDLAFIVGTSVSATHRWLNSLELEGLVVSEDVDGRRVRLDPDYPAAAELRALLVRLAAEYPDYARLPALVRAGRYHAALNGTAYSA